VYFGGTITDYKIPQGILENRMPASVGVPFSEMAHIICKKILVILGRYPPDTTHWVSQEFL
jgi:hypothetical protein